jgi:hypothetical protein
MVLGEYKELLEILNDGVLTDTERKIELCALFMGRPPDDPIFDEWSQKDLERESLRFTEWLKNIKPPDSFVLDGKNLTFMKFSTLHMGEYIDLSIYFKSSRENLSKIAAILWRQHKEDEWGNLIKEPYIFDVDERAKLFSEAPFEITAIIQEWSSFQENLVKIFPSIYEESNWDEIEDPELIPPEELEKIKKSIEEDKRRSHLIWPTILMDLADGDPIRFKTLLDMPLLLVLNLLALKKTRGK